MNKDEKARVSIILNLENEPTTMSTSSLMSGAITLAVWNKLKDTYQTNNIQSKLSLRKTLHTIKFDRKRISESTWPVYKKHSLSGSSERPCGRQGNLGFLLCSLPEEFSFLSIMANTQSMDYDSVCAILKADAKRKKRFQRIPDTNTAS